MNTSVIYLKFDKMLKSKRLIHRLQLSRTVPDLLALSPQGLIQDFLLGGGNHIFEIFLDILDSRTDEFSYNNFSNST